MLETFVALTLLHNDPTFLKWLWLFSDQHQQASTAPGTDKQVATSTTTHDNSRSDSRDGPTVDPCAVPFPAGTIANHQFDEKPHGRDHSSGVEMQTKDKGRFGSASHEESGQPSALPSSTRITEAEPTNFQGLIQNSSSLHQNQHTGMTTAAPMQLPGIAYPLQMQLGATHHLTSFSASTPAAINLGAGGGKFSANSAASTPLSSGLPLVDQSRGNAPPTSLSVSGTGDGSGVVPTHSRATPSLGTITGAAALPSSTPQQMPPVNSSAAMPLPQVQPLTQHHGALKLAANGLVVPQLIFHHAIQPHPNAATMLTQRATIPQAHPQLSAVFLSPSIQLAAPQYRLLQPPQIMVMLPSSTHPGAFLPVPNFTAQTHQGPLLSVAVNQPTNVSSPATAQQNIQGTPIAAAVAATEDNRDTNSKATLLYMQCDEDVLCPSQIFLRKQIELFEAQSLDIELFVSGRRRPVVLGQIGIRCRHCAHLHPSTRKKGSAYYPSRLNGIYQAAQNIASSHLCDSCESVDGWTKSKLLEFQFVKTRKGYGGKNYWGQAAKALQVIETDAGLKFDRKSENET